MVTPHQFDSERLVRDNSYLPPRKPLGRMPKQQTAYWSGSWDSRTLEYAEYGELPWDLPPSIYHPKHARHCQNFSVVDVLGGMAYAKAIADFPRSTELIVPSEIKLPNIILAINRELMACCRRSEILAHRKHAYGRVSTYRIARSVTQAHEWHSISIGAMTFSNRNRLLQTMPVARRLKRSTSRNT